MVGRAVAVVNQALVIRNWFIGAYLVEYEQGGADRAKYGAKLLERLAKDLEARQIKGLGVSILKNCRQFFQMYPQIRQPLVGELGTGLGFEEIRQPVVGEFNPSTVPKRIPGSVTPELREAEISSPLVRKSTEPLPTPLTTETVLRFSWTHLLEFIRIQDPWKRGFYENE